MKKIIIIGLLFLNISCTSNEDSKTVKTGDIILTHFSLSLVDGTRLDDSKHEHSKKQEGQPLKFKVGKREVIKAWDKGVIGMKKGEIRKVIVPPESGYGATGVPVSIQAKDTLVLVVELVDWVD